MASRRPTRAIAIAMATKKKARVLKRARVAGSRVRAARLHVGLRQLDVSRLCKVTITTANRWEANGADFVTFLGILSALGLPKDWKPET